MIEVMRTPTRVTMGELVVGESFVLAEFAESDAAYVFVRLAAGDTEGKFNAVNVRTGELHFFQRAKPVTIVKAKLIWEVM